MQLDAGTFLLQLAAGGLAVLLGDDPSARGEPRLRLAAAQHLRRPRDRGRRDPARGRSRQRRDPRARCRARGRRRALGLRRPARRRRARTRRAARGAQGAGRGDGRPRDRRRHACGGRRPRRVPSRARSHRAGVRVRGPARRVGVRGRPGRARGRAPRRRCRVPRRGERRDAPRPLVPRAAGAAPRRAQGARRAGPASSGRSRSRCSCGRPASSRCSPARSTTATTGCSRGSGWCARSRRSASSS